MMRFKLVIAAAAAIVSGVLLAGAPALAEQPTLMGSFKSWYVYSVGADVNRVCYALSQPSATLPKGARRDAIYILISTWPARGIRNEPSVVSGYPYKEGVPAQITIGNDKFTLFTENKGTDGGAWIKSPENEARLIEAMKHGISMSVSGVSRRGTHTEDTYPLAGFSDAMNAIASACK